MSRVDDLVQENKRLQEVVKKLEKIINYDPEIFPDVNQEIEETFEMMAEMEKQQDNMQSNIDAAAQIIIDGDSEELKEVSVFLRSLGCTLESASKDLERIELVRSVQITYYNRVMRALECYVENL
jgi:lipopolysaccharide biosynthesis regulator YciM